MGAASASRRCSSDAKVLDFPTSLNKSLGFLANEANRITLKSSQGLPSPGSPPAPIRGSVRGANCLVKAKHEHDAQDDRDDRTGLCRQRNAALPGQPGQVPDTP